MGIMQQVLYTHTTHHAHTQTSDFDPVLTASEGKREKARENNVGVRNKKR